MSNNLWHSDDMNKRPFYKSETPWYSPEAGFFGALYQMGDDSLEGYLSKTKQTQDERTKEEVEGVIQLLDLKQAAKICDCPCGIGRHSIELAKMGHQVLAVDNNPSQLSELHKRIIVERVAINWNIQPMIEDMRYLIHSPNHEPMDAVINMFFSFGFFNSYQENRLVARNFFDLLKPGGKFLMHTDVNMAHIRSGKYKSYERRHLKNGLFLIITECYLSDTKRIEGCWTLVDKENELFGMKGYSVRVYEVEEFVALCKSVGFKEVKTYSDWQESPYSEEAEMIIFVAEK
ncbi:MAG: class I SAM-dependent methyltransferase [Candidatus Nomurabacteria bacterium]|nr:class I SAM-dependent methyltransferase [Candidatus Nomurabacteria bacterium]